MLAPLFSIPAVERLTHTPRLTLRPPAAADARTFRDLLCDPANSGADAPALAREKGMLIVRDDASLDRWCDQAIGANEKVVADVRGGKVTAVGRLVGEVMKLSGGTADAKVVRERLLAKLQG